MGTTPKNKAIDAEYLLNQLKNLDKDILETKYVQEKDVKDTYTATDENPISGKGVSVAVNTLQQDINGKSNIGHKHTKSEITDFPTSIPPTAHTHDDRYYTESEINTKLNAKLNTSLKGSANGLAELDANGKVPSSQLPSFVDDIIEGYLSGGKFYKESAHTTEITGETGKIYIDLTTNKTYRWSGSAFVVVSETLALGETSSTAYRGDRGKTAYDHSQSTHARTDATKVEKSSTNGNIKINGTETTVYTHPSGTNPHGTTKSDVGLGNVGNFKAVSTVANQGLTEAEKSNARANIGAGVSSFSGSYNDLTNKPTIPTVGNGTVTIKQAGASKGTFTMNQSGNTTIELTDNNTTYGVATSSALGLVKSGTDITVDSSGNVSVNDDSHNHVISNIDGLQNALDEKLSKTTYEYNKELALSSSGKVCIGVFPCYDSNISVEIKSTTNTTYNGTLVIATQNIDTSLGGVYSATVYGDEKNTLTSAIKIQYLSGSNAFSVYINLPSWSKNLLHIQCVSLAGTPSSIATIVDSIPSTATIVPTNAFTHTHTELMSKNNPTGTGSFSLNRKSDTPIGINSTAEGLDCTASGDYSHAEGKDTTASASYTHSEGVNTSAVGQSSHAEGSNLEFSERYHTTIFEDPREVQINDTTTITVVGSQAFGLNSHAEGCATLAYGKNSHTEGYHSVAKANESHAEGCGSEASGTFAHSEGFETKASNNASHAEGYKTTASGSYSHAEGYNTVASGSYSHAEGYYTTATGSSNVCHAEGYKTLASGRYSHAEGSSTNSSGDSSHVEGSSTIAKGSYSHAEGYGTNASGNYSHAEGNATKATGTCSHAEGNVSSASGYYSHAEGFSSTAKGNYSHAEGYDTNATGACSHAEGYRTKAGIYSHAEGAYSTAGVTYGHAEGYYCRACGASGGDDSGDAYAGAHAGGNYSTAGGLGSFAHGNHIVAMGNQLVIGHYNKRGTSWINSAGWYSGINSGTGTSTAFLIGNGTSSSQSNAMRADYNGKLWCLQAYSATGADYAELFEWEDGNKNNEDRRGYFVTLDGINIKKATSTDDYILGVISAAPTVIGNGDDEWSGRYLRDKFGSFITVKEQEEKIVTDNYIDENGDMQTSERVVTYEYEHYKENPEYDPNREYVDRIHRPEWDAVGMMGVLIVRQDGTAIVNKYVCSNDEGIATLCEKKECSYRVIEVIDNETIKILIK